LRSAQTSHGEIITSKGKAGIGKLFFVANAPNTTAGTGLLIILQQGFWLRKTIHQVTVTWTTSGIQFIGAPATFTGNTQTFTLNKGQSYILAGNNGTPANLTGFIGGKIVSDKPISLTNGSANGNLEQEVQAVQI
jgi:hypothetical protein